MSLLREEVEPDRRGAMTPARKRRIWEREGGLCRCGSPVPVSGPGVTYDHEGTLYIEGSDADARIFPLCDPCNGQKTNGPRGDLSRIAKTKRQARMMTKTPKGNLKGRGFSTHLTKGFDGKVRPRKQRTK